MFDIQELNSERLKNTDNLKIHEVVARATPTKNTEIKVSDVDPEWFSPNPYPAVLRIRYILVRIRTQLRVLLLSSSVTFQMATKNCFLLISVLSYIYIIFQI